MKKKNRLNYFVRSIALIIVLALTGSVWAWEGMATPKLHVEGPFLKDPSGKNVLLHGWMQPTETWFNGGGRWYSNPSDWTNPSNVAGMLNYLCNAATVMSDTSPQYGRDHGWYCSFVRVNTDSIGGWTQQDGLVNPTQFDAWIQNFVVPYAAHLRSRGLYLVLSATGPINTPDNGSRNAGVVEQQRLITFWQTVANAPGVKGADNIHFELMNEPVDIESVPGNGDWGNHAPQYFQAFRDWIQPVINVIRNTGADNVIWVPTLEWQGSPHQHAQYPFTGTNCGVACHYYPAYGGVFDNPVAVQNLWDSQYKPAADQWPMIITEMFWTPYPDDPWNLVNGHTDGFGNAIKNAMDNQGNVSYIVGFLSDLLDDLSDYLLADCALSSREGAQAYFDWLPDYTSAGPTDRPRGLIATMVTGAQINLIWTAVPDALSYNIKRSTSSGGPYTTIASNIIGNSYSDTNVISEMPYYYIVSANMLSGESPNSNEASAISLHAYLMFNETSGISASDFTGNGWDGTLVDDPDWNMGKFGNAIDLDGSNDYISLPAGVIDGLTDITISTWVYLDTISTWSRIFDFGNDTGVNMYLTPRNSSGVASFAISTNAGTVLVDDHFDDGAIGTNTAGIGSGFNSWDGEWSATVTETGSNVTIHNPVHGGSRASIASKDGAAIGSGVSRFKFRGIRFAVANNTTSGTTARNCIGVKEGNAAWDYDNGLPTGFWIQFENDSLLALSGTNDGWNGTTVLFYEASDNSKTVLATWEFDTLNWDSGIPDFTPILDMTLDLGADGYSLTVEGDSITLLSGSLSNTYADAGITNELMVGYATAYVQSENPNVNISIDQIAVLDDIEEQITGTEELPVGLWKHVAVTRHGDTGVLYVDGKEIGRNSSMTLTPNSLGATTNNFIGFSQFSQAPYLDGLVDEFRIYPVALSESQVETLYNTEVPEGIPSIPSDVNATAVSISQIDLMWSPASDATNYNIKRSSTSGGPYTTIASTGATSFRDTGLLEGTTYHYVISSVNGIGESIHSMQVDVTTLAVPPAVPSGLVAIAGDGSVTLEWNANTEGDLAGYNVYRSTTSTSGYTLLNGFLLNAPEFADHTADNFSFYYYVVTAVDFDTNESGYSDEVNAVPFDSRVVQLSGTDCESGLGDWVNISGDDSHDWTIDSGGTLTPNTGPSGGADGSTWYMYLETSPGGAASVGNTAILESPEIQGCGRILTFYYHMYGIDIGTLAVDVYDGMWHNDVWSLSGQQHHSDSEAYTQALLDLRGYPGPIQIRFRAVAAGGARGDIAIDNIEVFGRPLYGDINGDGYVDAGDFSEFISYWLQEDCYWDLDGDCVITLYEFAEFAGNWMQYSQ